MRIKLHKRLLGKPDTPKFVNPYGENPHLKPYDRKEAAAAAAASPFSTFGKPTIGRNAPAVSQERKVGFFAEFLGFVFADIDYVASSVSGRTKRMKELRIEREKKKKENEEKYSAFVELATK